jgi:hypothetical protein
MASGTPSWPSTNPRFVAGDAPSSPTGRNAEGNRTAIAQRERLVAAKPSAEPQLARATAERTLAVHREILGT